MNIHEAIEVARYLEECIEKNATETARLRREVADGLREAASKFEALAQADEAIAERSRRVRQTLLQTASAANVQASSSPH